MTGGWGRSAAVALRSGAAVVLIGVGTSGCGSGSEGGSGGETSPDDVVMNLGDADAVAATDIDGAELSSGDFVLLATRPDGHDATEGTAHLALHDGGTTVTMEMTGLIPDVDYIAHVHVDSCAEAGGAHFRFDPAGASVPPNEIHLAFTAADDGSGFMTAENTQVAGTGAGSVVLHALSAMDSKIACADVR